MMKHLIIPELHPSKTVLCETTCYEMEMLWLKYNLIQGVSIMEHFVLMC